MYGEKLKIIREILAVGQEQMASNLQISFSTYRRLENSKSTITTEQLEILFNELQISPIYFFYGIEPIFINQIEFENNILLKKVQEKIIMNNNLIEKIKTIKEQDFWNTLISTSEHMFEILIQALENINFQSNPETSKNDLIELVKSIPTGFANINLRVPIFEKDVKKVLDFIQTLDNLECYIIIQNAKVIIKEIKSNRFFFNR